MRAFEVDLVVNRGDAENAREHGEPIAAAGRAQLGASLRLAGCARRRRSVPAAVERGVPVMQLFPGSRFCTDIHALVASLFASEPASATRAFALAALAPRARAASAARRGRDRRAPAPLRCGAPGRYLRERREQLGLDLAALHERTRIRHHYLEAIEAERFDALPPDVFLREYVRQVAARARALRSGRLRARSFVAKARASRAAWRWRAPWSRAYRPAAAAAADPEPEELLAAFDYEPELEAFAAPEPSRARARARPSVAEVQAFLAPSSARASPPARLAER